MKIALDAKVKESKSPTIVPGNTLRMSPKWSVNLGAEYLVPVSSFGSMSFGLNWAQMSKIYYDNVDTEVLADNFSMLNGHVSTESPDVSNFSSHGELTCSRC